jgi:hypothetical protein
MVVDVSKKCETENGIWNKWNKWNIGINRRAKMRNRKWNME